MAGIEDPIGLMEWLRSTLKTYWETGESCEADLQQLHLALAGHKKGTMNHDNVV